MAEIKDSGARREFASGAVRDIQEGKGRCDLLPLDIVGEFFEKNNPEIDNKKAEKYIVVGRILQDIDIAIREGKMDLIRFCIKDFAKLNNWTISTMFMEVSKHYEEGAKKYAERNWEKGINCHCYVDSGVRHLFKWLDGWDDEPHDRAFIWNMLGLLWTAKHKAELIDLPFMHEKVITESNKAEDAEWGTVEERMKLLEY